MCIRDSINTKYCAVQALWSRRWFSICINLSPKEGQCHEMIQHTIRLVSCFEKPISKDLKVRQFCWLYLRFEWTSRQRRDLMVKSLTLIKNALSNGKLEKENYEFRAHSALNYQPQLDWNSGTGCSEIGLRCEFTLTSIQLLLKLIEACFDRSWDPYSSQGASLQYIEILFT